MEGGLLRPAAALLRVLVSEDREPRAALALPSLLSPLPGRRWRCRGRPPRGHERPCAARPRLSSRPRPGCQRRRQNLSVVLKAAGAACGWGSVPVFFPFPPSCHVFLSARRGCGCVSRPGGGGEGGRGAEAGVWPMAGPPGRAGRGGCREGRPRAPRSRLSGCAGRGAVGRRAAVGLGLRKASDKGGWSSGCREAAASRSAKNPEEQAKSLLLYVLWHLFTHITIYK